MMEQAYKTKEVSALLGVNPTTVQRWVKYFNLHCQINEHGHYIFLAPHVELLKEIHSQLREGKKLKDIKISSSHSDLVNVVADREKKDMVPRHVYFHKIDDMMERIEQLESKLSQKADDVVSYQLLNHRSEIDAMGKMLKNIENKLAEMEEKLAKAVDTDVATELVNGKEKKRSFMQLFSSL